MVLERKRQWAFSLLIVLFTSLLTDRANSEVITTAVGVGGAVVLSGFLAGYEYFKCKSYECCDDSWIRKDVEGLRATLRRRLYGQPLVHDTVVKVIRAHIRNKAPQKALVLSFHGWTGGGKNYVAGIIAESLYARSMDSKHVHLFIGTHHFPDAGLVDVYKAQLRAWITGNVTQCDRSLFIFDELDKIHPEVLNAIKPFLDHYTHINGVDFRRSIFLFLSNTGATDISNAALVNFRAGRGREELLLKDMDELIRQAAFNEEGGLRFSSLISNHLIDHFVPFLPLERAHVKLCVRDYLAVKSEDRRRQQTRDGVPVPDMDADIVDELVDEVADSLQYFPKGYLSTGGVFGTAGCKGVVQKTELILQTREDEHEDL